MHFSGGNVTHSHSTDALQLGICQGLTIWQCDLHSLDHMSQFYTLLDRKLIRPFLYVVAAELMPLIYTLHRNSTSHHYWKMRPESPVARFKFSEVSHGLKRSLLFMYERPSRIQPSTFSACLCNFGIILLNNIVKIVLNFRFEPGWSQVCIVC